MYIRIRIDVYVYVYVCMYVCMVRLCVCLYTRNRFSQFFISPLFTESATDREMKAVHNGKLTYLLTHLLTYSLTHLLTYSLTHLLTYSLTHLLTYSLTHLLTYSLTHSENEKNLLVDAWRINQLMKSTANPNFPFCKFGTGECMYKSYYSHGHILIYSYTHILIYSYTHILIYSYTHVFIYSYARILIYSGNLETLGETADRKTRERLIKFYSDHYSSNVMRLVLLGRGEYMSV